MIGKKKRKKADGKTGAVSYTVTLRLKGHSSRYPQNQVETKNVG